MAIYCVNPIRFTKENILKLLENTKRNYGIKLEPETYVNFKPVYCDTYLLEKLLTELFENVMHHGNNTQPVYFSCSVREESIYIKLAYKSKNFTLAEYKKVKPFIKDISVAENTTKGLGIGICLSQQIIKKVNGSMQYNYNKKNDIGCYYINGPLHLNINF